MPPPLSPLTPTSGDFIRSHSEDGGDTIYELKLKLSDGTEKTIYVKLLGTIDEKGAEHQAALSTIFAEARDFSQEVAGRVLNAGRELEVVRQEDDKSAVRYIKIDGEDVEEGTGERFFIVYSGKKFAVDGDFSKLQYRQIEAVQRFAAQFFQRNFEAAAAAESGEVASPRVRDASTETEIEPKPVSKFEVFKRFWSWLRGGTKEEPESSNVSFASTALSSEAEALRDAPTTVADEEDVMESPPPFRGVPREEHATARSTVIQGTILASSRVFSRHASAAPQEAPPTGLWQRVVSRFRSESPEKPEEKAAALRSMPVDVTLQRQLLKETAPYILWIDKKSKTLISESAAAAPTSPPLFLRKRQKVSELLAELTNRARTKEELQACFYALHKTQASEARGVYEKGVEGEIVYLRGILLSIACLTALEQKTDDTPNLKKVQIQIKAALSSPLSVPLLQQCLRTIAPFL